MAILGIVILLVGIVMMPYSNVTTQHLVTEEPPVDEATPGNPPVSVSGYFSAGELYNVYISPGIGWDQNLEPATNETPYDSRFVWVNMTDPLGNTTIFEFAFGAVDSSMALYMISVLAANFSRERTAPSPSAFALQAKVNGTYTAKLWAVIPSAPNPFGAFQLNRLHIEDQRSFSYLLYVGAGASISGIAVSVLAKLEPWKQQRKKQLKKKTYK